MCGYVLTIEQILVLHNKEWWYDRLMYFSFSLSVLACSNSGINSSTSWTMACKECFDISKYTGFYSSKTPSHKLQQVYFVGTL